METAYVLALDVLKIPSRAAELSKAIISRDWPVKFGGAELFNVGLTKAPYKARLPEIRDSVPGNGTSSRKA